MPRKKEITLGDKRVAFAAFALLIFGSLMIASAEMGNSAGDASYLTGVLTRQVAFSFVGIIAYLILTNMSVSSH